MLPSTYNDVLAHIAERTEKKTKSYQESLARTHERHRLESDLLTERTLTYLQTGIADLRTSGFIDVRLHGTGWGQRGFIWSMYFRQLAKELKRPFVRVRSRYVYDYGNMRSDGRFRSYHATELVLPRRRYLHPVESMFFITSDEVVTQGGNTVDRTYTFRGDAGQELFERWHEMVRTSAECRRALRVI